MVITAGTNCSCDCRQLNAAGVNYFNFANGLILAFMLLKQYWDQLDRIFANTWNYAWINMVASGPIAYLVKVS